MSQLSDIDNTSMVCPTSSSIFLTPSRVVTSLDPITGLNRCWAFLTPDAQRCLPAGRILNSVISRTSSSRSPSS